MKEGKLCRGRSSSKGKLKRIKFKGKPNIESLCKLLELRLEGSKLLFFRITEVFMREDAFGVITDRISLHEFLFDTHSGEVLKKDNLSGEGECVKEIKPAPTLEGFLPLVPGLWGAVDTL